MSQINALAKLPNEAFAAEFSSNNQRHLEDLLGTFMKRVLTLFQLNHCY